MSPIAPNHKPAGRARVPLWLKVGYTAFVAVLVDRQEGGREKIEAMGHPVFALFTKGELLEGHARPHRRADCTVA